MVGKGAMVSYASSGGSATAAPSKAPVAAKPTAISSSVRADVPRREAAMPTTRSGDVAEGGGASKPALSQSPIMSNAARLGRAEHAAASSSHQRTVAPSSRGKSAAETTTLDDDDDDSHEAHDGARQGRRDIGESMQQMDTLLTSLQSKEARLNWMLEAVRSCGNGTTRAHWR